MLAEQLVGEARARLPRAMDSRERVVLTVAAAAFLLAALTIAFVVPNERPLQPLVLVGLMVGFPLVERVRFEFGGTYNTPEQLVFVPILLLAPLPYIPLVIAVCMVSAYVPDFVRGTWHRERIVGRIADCWLCIPPVLVLGFFAPGELSLSHLEIYAFAYAAQVAGDFTWAAIRDQLCDGLSLGQVVSQWVGIGRADSVFALIGFVITLVAVDHPVALLAIAPLVWLLYNFSKDREQKYAKTLELHRAYRGTVMLLSDVVEFEDDYTAQHSRSVVDLANAVAAQMGVPENQLLELEFAAMLHDIGKIAIPKEILNKPSALTDEEFRIMMDHTIEGQFMLDRVGGLLAQVGEIVRSCHERWDGTGYPDGLKGEEIPLAARIVFACDAYHAMTSDRVYRAAMSTEDAIAELLRNSGTQFDPAVVVALLQVIEQG
ncbi:MAG TPA: HD-GYP domain-containing protein, partial [Thermoleophilaceae bacterium]|nr:HD-GYP domain-containing protein [Thermoleophilaceae bacterium]